jgi:predicted O-methyltransferase YrrM
VGEDDDAAALGTYVFVGYRRAAKHDSIDVFGGWMQQTIVKNVLRQALRRDRLPIMVKKLWRRVFGQAGRKSRAENIAWLESHCSSFSSYALEIDGRLWDEALVKARYIQDRSLERLRAVEHDLGGGGVYPLLYFIARLRRPAVVVETGVAAGFSSFAFLLGLRENGSGKLYSSDFPYFRLPNPERYIGIVIDEPLREGWELLLDGDERNLPVILKKVARIDVFHYDSDKSYTGRERAMALIAPVMADDGIVLMDDVQDNSFFWDYVEEVQPASWRVFEFEGKYIGMIGKLVHKK